MADQPSDDTVRSFPTYAELTQTQAWASSPKPIHSDDDAVRSAERSGGSRYTEGAVLGVGGMGKVMLARDARIGREVAVKVLHAERELSPDERTRFLREAQVQGQLEHPSIVPVYDIELRPDGSTFFTMRRVIGRTLHAIVEDLRAGARDVRARYTQRELLTAFATVCLTIDYAHTRGVIHRDLKPANIMFGDFGEVYVLDWGLARLLDASAPSTDAPASRLSRPGEMMGTPLYMAPEQMTDPDVGPSADVWALGAILFEMLTLERLRDPLALFAPVEARPSVRTPELRIALELELICVRATQLDAAERYPSARALHEALTRYLEGDRELEQRRALAAEHASTARAALDRAQAAATDPDYERERGVAMRELGRAIAVDPTDREHVAMLAELMSTPLRTMPDEIRTQLRTSAHAAIRTGAHQALLAMFGIYAFLPLLLWIGVRDRFELAVILGGFTLSGVFALIAVRQRVVGTAVQVALVTAAVAAMVAITRMFGPLVLTPTMIASYTISLQSHPTGWLRRYTLIMGSVAIVLPLALELVGVLPSSYRFEHGTMVIVPQVIELPQVGSLVLLVSSTLAMTVIPSFFIARLRAQLSEAERRQLVRAWHFRRLGDEMMGR
jgi:serine/threonine-protein kinase